MFEKLKQFGVVPVVAVDSPDDGMRLCEALLAGGLPVAEITFRTAAAEATIKAAAEKFPEIILGAGTVLTPDQLKKAQDAGAKFAVAPGCNPSVIEAANSAGFPFAPGVCTPSDVERAVQLNMQTLKFFPAEAVGGIKMLKALLGPYGHLGLSFCPTGGITEKNLLTYLEIKQVAFVGGTWIANKEMIQSGAWQQITKHARDAVRLAQHVSD